MSRKYSLDMTGGSTFKNLLLFAFPVMLSGMLQLVFNTADVIVVGRFAGDECLAAVGSTTAPCHLITNMLIGVSTGANVVVANAIGEKNEKRIGETIHTTVMLGIIGGISIGILGISVTERLLNAMGTPPDVLPLAIQYVKIIFIGTPAMSLFNFCSAVLRAKGDTRRPLNYLTISGVVNIALNLLFVIVFDMDVEGVALATIISQTMSAGMIFVCLLREDAPYRVSVRKMRLIPEHTGEILRIGIPAGIQTCMLSLSNVVVQSSINRFGKIIVAGSAASNSAEHFQHAAVNCFTQAGVSFISQNVGAGQTDRIPEIMRKVVGCATLSGAIAGGGMVLFRYGVIGLFTENPAVIEAGAHRMLYLCLPYFMFGIMDSISGITRGMGFSLMPAAAALMGNCLFRLLWVRTVCELPMCSTIDWVYMAYPTSWIFTIILHGICYRIAYKRTTERNQK